MFRSLGQLTTRHSRLVLVVAGLFVVLSAVLGVHASSKLLPAGFVSPSAPSQQATDRLDKYFDGGSPNLTLLVTARAGTVDSPAAATAGRELVRLLDRTPWVSHVTSYWTTGNAALRSKDATKALIQAHITGTDAQLQSRSTSVISTVTSSPVSRSGAVLVQAGGLEGTYDTVSRQISKDLALAEGIAIPVTSALLILVFGSVVAALLPVAIGLLAIVGTLAVLYLLGSTTTVSVYALNVTTAMGLGLAIDYGLLMVNRYREELASGIGTHAAVRRAVATAGRTIVFSAATVAAAMAALLVFPVYFLRSFAYAGISVIIVATAGAVIVLPALLAVLGDRVNKFQVRRRPSTAVSPFWSGVARRVMRRPVLAGAAVVALLLVLGSPFLHVHFGTPDDRVLPTSSTARQVGDALRTDFGSNADNTVEVVTTAVLNPSEAAAYGDRLSKVPGVVDVIGPTSAATRANGAGDWFTAIIRPDPLSGAAANLVNEVRAIAPPAGAQAYVGGQAASLVDQKHDLGSRLPLAMLLIALTTFVVLFLFTGSVVMPLKALALNGLSLTAVLGATVWVFQDGHLSGLLGFTPTSMSTTMPLLLFCIAFGLSMDYEVFLLSRIKELHDAGASNEEAVVGGLARSGRIVTTAAALLCVTFFAFGLSKVSFIQMFGLGTGFAILLDATLVRGVLVPSFMRLAGDFNWWAPAPLVRLHRRIGISEPLVPVPVSPNGRSSPDRVPVTSS